ncbi:MAG TPA: efflux RND transporter permease subunit [Verrucomicrobiae bacterium]|nr:efflux RND transporter permease subunit [Verrucomicrobiae bacterium]
MSASPEQHLPEDHTGRMVSGLTEFSLRRRITLLVLLMSIVVVGIVATVGIPVELFPRGFTSQSLFVFVPWQNAPTQEVLDKIALPLEEELSTVRGLDNINSISSLGNCRVFLRFKQGTDMDVAYREVRDRIQRARLHFPDDVDRVFIRKQDASGIPVCVIGLAMDPSLTDPYNLIKREVLQRIERIDGVANVTADGLEEKEIIIELDKQKTEGHGLNIYQLAQALGGDNFTMASGHVRDAGKKFMLRSLASYKSLEELENRPVTPTVKLKDIARIKYEEPEKRYSVRVNSRPAVAAVIFKEGEANTVEVSARIRKEFKEMEKNPRLASIHMEVLFNQGEVIEESLDKLVESGIVGGVLAAVILFIFLRRFRLTGIITLSIPLSLLIALAVMFFADESLNVLTILALVIAVGMLVDDSIVVAENIQRMHNEGLPRRAACIRGAGEIALAIMMSTLTTIVVFVPVALVEGQGQFFLMRLALPLSVSVVASLVVALAFVPLSVYITLPANDAKQRHVFFRWSHAKINAVMARFYDLTFERVNRFYHDGLDFFLKRRLDLVLVLVATFAATYFVAIKKIDIVEQQEEEQTGFEIGVEISNEYSYEDIAEYFMAAEKVLEQKKDEYGLKGYFVFYRRLGGRVEGWFDEDKPGKLTAKQVGEKLVKELPKKPGIKLHFGRENQAEDAKGREVFVFRLEGDDAGVLDDVVARLEPMILRIDGVLGIRRGEEPSPSEMALVVDRDRANVSSVSPEVIAGLVGYALRGSSLPKFNQDGREIPVRVRFQEKDRESLTDLSSFQIPVEGGGGYIPLSALMSPRVLNTPKHIFRSNKRISRTMTAELKKEVTREARDRLMALQRQISLPEGVSFSQSRVMSMDEEISNMMFAGGMSVLFVYLLMGFLFESFILPLSIILTIPLAGIGVAWIHYLTGKDIDFLGVVGAILLVGVVVKNGIVLIDYVIRLRAAGMERTQALLTSSTLRFRPIIMTALTTVIGIIPLTFARPNDMGLSYKSFGLTLIGGMTTATLLTMLVVPVFYTFFDDARVAFMRVLRLGLRQKTPETAPAASPEKQTV